MKKQIKKVNKANGGRDKAFWGAIIAGVVALGQAIYDGVQTNKASNEADDAANDAEREANQAQATDYANEQSASMNQSNDSQILQEKLSYKYGGNAKGGLKIKRK